MGIVLGFGLGSLANLHPTSLTQGLGAMAGPVGQGWIRALLLVVVPLIVCQLILAASGDGVKRAAKVGGASLAVFVTMMVASAIFCLSVATPLLRHAPSDRGAMALALERASDLSIPAADTTGAGSGFAEGLVRMIPDNIFGAAAQGDLIGLILVSLVFGLALSRIGPQKEQVLALVRALGAAVMMATYWVILALPVGAFALAFDVASRTGLGLAGILGWYLAVHIAMLVGLVLLLYPVTALIGGGILKEFARSVWPAQGVAMSTRSSLASLPALMKGARDGLGLPEDVVSLTLPLGASTFKMNTLISSLFKLLFLGHVYGVALDPTFLLLFVGVQILTAPSVPGIPSGGYVMTLPLYVAAGVPLEGVIFLKALDGIPDIFKTLLNTTGYMTSAVVVARLTGWRRIVPAAAMARDL